MKSRHKGSTDIKESAERLREILQVLWALNEYEEVVTCSWYRVQRAGREPPGVQASGAC